MWKIRAEGEGETRKLTTLGKGSRTRINDANIVNQNGLTICTGWIKWTKQS